VLSSAYTFATQLDKLHPSRIPLPIYKFPVESTALVFVTIRSASIVDTRVLITAGLGDRVGGGTAGGGGRGACDAIGWNDLGGVGGIGACGVKEYLSLGGGVNTAALLSITSTICPVFVNRIFCKLLSTVISLREDLALADVIIK
jgi:hypothetical protein